MVVLIHSNEHTARVNAKHPLCGAWVAPNPDDTGDYCEAEYHILAKKGEFQVVGIDRIDDEAFVISDVKWNGSCLSFKTLMPSIQRRGIMKLRMISKNEIELKFTFTITEIWQRKEKS